MGAEVSALSGRDTIVLSRVDAVNAVCMRDIPERVGWLAEQGRWRVRVRAQVRCLRSRSASGHGSVRRRSRWKQVGGMRGRNQRPWACLKGRHYGS
jgi:hypothetical protein